MPRILGPPQERDYFRRTLKIRRGKEVAENRQSNKGSNVAHAEARVRTESKFAIHSMPDPKVLQPANLEFYERPTLMPEFYEAKPKTAKRVPRDSIEGLVQASNIAHSNVRKLVQVNDKLRADQLDLIGIIKEQRKWLRWGMRTIIPALLVIIEELIRR